MPTIPCEIMTLFSALAPMCLLGSAHDVIKASWHGTHVHFAALVVWFASFPFWPATGRLAPIDVVLIGNIGLWLAYQMGMAWGLSHNGRRTGQPSDPALTNLR